MCSFGKACMRKAMAKYNEALKYAPNWADAQKSRS